MFLTDEEDKLTEEYLRQGYVIRPAADLGALDWIRKKFVSLSTQELGDEDEPNANNWLNQIHESVSLKDLNDFRVKMIDAIMKNTELILRKPLCQNALSVSRIISRKFFA